MRMTAINGKVYGEILRAWDISQKEQPEEMRSRDVLDFLLKEHEGTFWYYGPTEHSFFYVNEVVPGRQAVLHAISSDGAIAMRDRAKVQKILLSILKDLAIHRLSVAIPAPMQAVRAAAGDLGFKYEGRLREAAQMQGDWVDVVVFGFLERDAKDPLKRRKRRRRTRRKTKRPQTGTVSVTSEAEKSTEEEPTEEK